MSALQLQEILGCARSAFAVRRLRTPDLGDGGYDLSGHPHPFVLVVPSDVVDHHLDEFTFRFNRRKSASLGKLFFRLVQQAVAVEPSPYDMIVGRTRAATQKIKTTSCRGYLSQAHSPFK